MSRHRDVRCMNYSDEYDGYDDVYGHSVEDDYCVSPSAEQFMFDRNKQPNIASYFTEPDIKEDNEEEEEDVPSSYKLPNLSELDTAKLITCVEAIKNVIGDGYPESQLNKKIIEFNYNTEAVLNSILNEGTKDKKKDTLPLEKNFVEAQSGSISENQSSGNNCQLKSKQSDINIGQTMNLKMDCEKVDKPQESSSLFDMISQTSKSNSNLNFTLGSLTKQSPSLSSGFTIPKLNFKNSKTLPHDPDSVASVNSLSDLSAFHLKSKEAKSGASDNTKSLPKFNIPKINTKNIRSDADEKDNFNSLTDLTAQLKVSNVSKHEKLKSLITPTNFVIPKLGSETIKSEEAQSGFDSLLDLAAHHLKSSNANISVGRKEMNTSKFDSNDMSDNQSVMPLLKNITNLNLNDDTNIGINTEKINHKSQLDSFTYTLETIRQECMLNEINNHNFKLAKKVISPFGKVLCKKYRRKKPYINKSSAQVCDYKHNQILRFDFSSPSPDSAILAIMNRKIIVAS